MGRLVSNDIYMQFFAMYTLISVKTLHYMKTIKKTSHTTSEKEKRKLDVRHYIIGTQCIAIHRHCIIGTQYKAGRHTLHHKNNNTKLDVIHCTIGTQYKAGRHTLHYWNTIQSRTSDITPLEHNT